MDMEYYQYFQMAAAVIILGIVYWRMVKRATSNVSVWRATVPVGFGVASVNVSFYAFLGFAILIGQSGLPDFMSQFGPWVKALWRSMVLAGIPEELTKLAFLLLALFLFRSQIKNVYDYILAGAAVGFGFTIFEEYLYGSDNILGTIMRLVTIAAHMIFGIIMGKHLGLSKHIKLASTNPAPSVAASGETGAAGEIVAAGTEAGAGAGAGAKGKGWVKEIVLAIVLPILFHSAYNMLTANNPLIDIENDDSLILAFAVAGVAMLVMCIAQIVILIRLKKNAEKYCSMSVVKEE